MLNKVPYSKAQFWHAILISFTFVTVSQLSSSVDALPADQDATKHEEVEIPKSSIENDGEEGERGILRVNHK